MLVEGRAAIVSGIGPGLGRSIARALAREGADVALAARTQESLDSVADEVRAFGRRAVAVPTDVSRPDECARLVETAKRELGRIDVLVLNAFLSAPYEPIESASLEGWRKIFDVNVFSALSLVQAVVPEMKARGVGSIVIVNSMSIRIVEPRFGGYAASKGALLTMSRTMAKELGAHGIRVNSIVPGYIWGPNVERYFQHQAKARGVTPEAVYAEVAAQTALNHIPTADEIAETVVFFASDLSRAVTGQSLDVNAGHYFD
ncbi:MAG: SDR family oxidoreductase [Candidatus Binatia bacterium]